MSPSLQDGDISEDNLRDYEASIQVSSCFVRFVLNALHIYAGICSLALGYKGFVEYLCTLPVSLMSYPF
jgi:hypothetical protein